MALYSSCRTEASDKIDKINHRNVDIAKPASTSLILSMEIVKEYQAAMSWSSLVEWQRLSSLGVL